MNKRNPVVTSQIHKVKNARAALNKRIKLFSALKNIGSQITVTGTNNYFGGVTSFLNLCGEVFHDGEQCSLLWQLRGESRMLHLLDNFLREVPYSKVEKEHAKAFEGVDVYGPAETKFPHDHPWWLYLSLVGTARHFGINIDFEVSQKLCNWLSSKVEIPIMHPVDANGSPV
jgi:hypothetical protein